MKTSGFKNKYSPLKRNASFKPSPFYSMKKSSFKKNKPLTPRQQLDSIVSKVVRLGSADEQGFVLCVTCGHKVHWSQIQCGHFQKRANTSTRYDIKNLGPQCEECNCFKDGENELFAAFIDAFYGEGTADKLRVQAREIMKNFPYEEEIIKWTEVYKKLVEEKANVIHY